METKYKEISTLKLLLIYTFFARKSIQRKDKTSSQRKKLNKTPARNHVFFSLGWGKQRGGSSGREKAGFVSVMYSPSARMKSGSDHIVASCAREEASFSKRSWTRERAGQVRMAC